MRELGGSDITRSCVLRRVFKGLESELEEVKIKGRTKAI